MEIIFLGTGCMVPTKDRNHQSILITHKGDGYLFDCGEGTQRQMKIADIKPTKINKIFISHWHGDHVLGLPGLLQTLNASEYEQTLEIYGPKNTKKHLAEIFKAFSFNINFTHKCVELSNNKLDFKNVVLESRELDHSVKCLGYSLKIKDFRKIKLSYTKKLGIPEGPLLGKLQNNEKITWNNKTITPEKATYVVKGKKISIILDTLPCKNADYLSMNSDILISEAVYMNELLEKAKEYKHMTSKQSAEMASRCNVEKLVLTHFSQRYKSTEKLLEEAKIVFKNTFLSHDLMKLKV